MTAKCEPPSFRFVTSFTASGNTITQTGQGAISAINMRAFHASNYYAWTGWTWRNIGYALEVENPNVLLNSIREGDTVTGANLPGGSSRARRSDYFVNWVDTVSYTHLTLPTKRIV